LARGVPVDGLTDRILEPSPVGADQVVHTSGITQVAHERTANPVQATGFWGVEKGFRNTIDSEIYFHVFSVMRRAPRIYNERCTR
jgi:hypothetical protein